MRYMSLPAMTCASMMTCFASAYAGITILQILGRSGIMGCAEALRTSYGREEAHLHFAMPVTNLWNFMAFLCPLLLGDVCTE